MFTYISFKVNNNECINTLLISIKEIIMSGNADDVISFNILKINHTEIQMNVIFECGSPRRIQRGPTCLYFDENELCQ